MILIILYSFFFRMRHEGKEPGEEEDTEDGDAEHTLDLAISTQSKPSHPPTEGGALERHSSRIFFCARRTVQRLSVGEDSRFWGINLSFRTLCTLFYF